MANESHLLLRYANETPELLSLLYDMDMMPEQLKERTHDWARMLMLVAAWKNRTKTMNVQETLIADSALEYQRIVFAARDILDCGDVCNLLAALGKLHTRYNDALARIATLERESYDDTN